MAARRCTPASRARTRDPEPVDTTAEGKTRFLDALRKSGVVLLACRAADVPRRTAYHWRTVDETFRAEWLDAVEDHTDALEAAAIHRALHGTRDRPPSDRLREKRLAARRPGVYGDRVSVTHAGRVDSEAKVTIRHPDPDVASAMDALSGAIAESKAAHVLEQAQLVDPTDPAVAAAARNLAVTLAQRGRGDDDRGGAGDAFHDAGEPGGPRSSSRPRTR